MNCYKRGQEIRCVRGYADVIGGTQFTRGRTYIVKHFDPDVVPEHGGWVRVEADDEGDVNGIRGDHFKPVNPNKYGKAKSRRKSGTSTNTKRTKGRKAVPKSKTL